MNIEFEDTKTLLAWHEEYCKPENRDKIILPNCIYNYHEILRELIRRERMEIYNA